MGMRSLIIPALLLFIVAAAATIAADEKGEQTPEQMMAEYAKYATPGEKHKVLEPLVGRWRIASKWWMYPGAPADTSSATCEVKWIMGGRFIQEDVEGFNFGQMFHGMGITGYDLIKNEYVGFWIDEMSTGFMLSTGQCDSAGKVLTMHSSYYDPIKKKNSHYKTVLSIENDDRHRFDMFEMNDDGSEFRNFEMIYTRMK